MSNFAKGLLVAALLSGVLWVPALYFSIAALGLAKVSLALLILSLSFYTVATDA